MDSQGFRQGDASVFLDVGGAFQGGTRLADSLHFDAVGYFDAASEVENVQTEDGVIKVALAPGDTLGTLLQAPSLRPHPELIAEVKKLERERPGLSLQDGMGQTPAIGYLAAMKFVAEPRFQELMEQILNRLMLRHNGLLRRISLTVAGGGGGGTGAGAAEVIETAAACYLLDNTSAQIDSDVTRLGALSFTGLGSRIPDNTTATLARDLEKHLSEDRDIRQSCSLTLTELPMVGGQKDLRDQYAVQLLQTLRATAVQENIKMFKPNHSTEAVLGSIRVIRPKYWRTINARRVAANVASLFVGELSKLIEEPPRYSAVETIELRVKRTRGNALRPAAIAREAETAENRPLNFLEMCTRPISEFEVGIDAHLKDSSAVDLLNPEVSCPLCYTVDEFASKLGICQTAAHMLAAKRREKLEQHGVDRRRQIEIQREERRRAVKGLKTAIARLFPGNIFQWTLAITRTFEARLDKFQDAVTRFQEVDEELRRLECEDQAIATADKKLRAEVDRELARLERVRQVLHAYAPQGPIRPADLLVNARSVDSILKQLLSMSVGQHENEEQRLINLLTKCAMTVTIKGLAMITGAKHASHEEIAWILAKRKPPVEAPIWGATDPLSEGTTIIVLPPVARRDEEKIRTSLSVLAPTKTLVSSDSAQGGVNVVILQLWKPQRLDDIFDQYLRSRLPQASNPICMPGGDAPLRRLEQLSNENGRS